MISYDFYDMNLYFFFVVGLAETVAKVTTGAIDEHNESSHSVLRRKSSTLLADEDKRYAGKTVSTKTLCRGVLLCNISMLFVYPLRSVYL